MKQNQGEQIIFEGLFPEDEIKDETTQEYERLDVDGNSIIVQQNYLIEKTPPLSRDGLKLFLTLVAGIDKDDKDLRWRDVDVTSIIKLWGLDTHNGYGQVKAALESLYETGFELETVQKNGKRAIQKFRYITDFSYVEGAATAKIAINSTFAPYLIGLSSNFTRFALSDISELTSRNSIRTYELLSSYLGLGKRRFTVQEYKDKIYIGDKYKGSISNLKKKVLDPVCDEICEKTSMYCSYEVQGRGQKAIIEFTMFSKDRLHKKVAICKFTEDEVSVLKDLLVTELSFNDMFSDNEIDRFINVFQSKAKKKYSVSDAFMVFRESYEEYLSRDSFTKINNPWGYLKAILEAKI